MNQKIMKNFLIKFKKAIVWTARTINEGTRILLIEIFYGLLFPKRDRGKVSVLESLYATDALPRTYVGIKYFLEYRNTVVKHTLWQFKYYLKPQALLQYTYILYDELVAEVSDRVQAIPFKVAHPLIHCPSSTFFKGTKKFDHMKELFTAFDSLQNVEQPFFTCCMHAILPSKVSGAASRAQHTGTRKERLEWAKQRFYISEKFEQYLISLKSNLQTPAVYCVDDVVTTGASLNAISKLFHDKFDMQLRVFCLCH